MSRFIIEQMPIKGLSVIQRQPIGDKRGYLERMFCSDELRMIIGQRNIVQINHTLSESAGTVRGMHYQRPPHAEMKLVSCLRGEELDVAVDLRTDSPTFLSWHAEILTAQNHRTFVIPEGFAHGFQTLTNDCELVYLHTAAYHPEAEAGVAAKDAELAIKWPRSITEHSERDQQYPPISSDFSGIPV